MKQPQVMIVGGGASGLVAAISAAREGAKVTIIEQKDRIGKKILSTGNGRCNLTNSAMKKECFRSDDLVLVESVLNQFSYDDTCSFFEGLGVMLKERQGYVYPISDQASTILDVLRMEIAHLGICVRIEESVNSITKKGKEFLLRTNKTQLTADAVILATGGKASSALGSDGSGYALAKSFGHHISPVVPALVQLHGKGDCFKQVSGVRTNAKVSLYVNGKFLAEDTGELQLTNYGISGIPVFQISRFAAKALYEKQNVLVTLDFLPTITKNALYAFVEERYKTQSHKTAEEFFVGMFHKKIIALLLKSVNIAPTKRVQELHINQIKHLLDISKNFKVEITQTNGFEQAQVCAGGVKTSEVHPNTLESIYAKNLYIIGELLDVDGICGGYNLQWAWATGFIAGKHAATAEGVSL